MNIRIKVTPYFSLKSQCGHGNTDHTSVAGSLTCFILEQAQPLSTCLPEYFDVTAHNQISPGLCTLRVGESCELTCCFVDFCLSK